MEGPPGAQILRLAVDADRQPTERATPACRDRCWTASPCVIIASISCVARSALSVSSTASGNRTPGNCPGRSISADGGSRSTWYIGSFAAQVIDHDRSSRAKFALRRQYSPSTGSAWTAPTPRSCSSSAERRCRRPKVHGRANHAARRAAYGSPGQRTPCAAPSGRSSHIVSRTRFVTATTACAAHRWSTRRVGVAQVVGYVRRFLLQPLVIGAADVDQFAADAHDCACFQQFVAVLALMYLARLVEPG